MCIDNMYVRMRENTSGIRPADHSVRDRHTVIICICKYSIDEVRLGKTQHVHIA